MSPSPRVFLIPLLCALIAWLPAVSRGGFCLDDREVLFGNPVVEGDLPLTAAFDRDYWHHREDAGHYRPLATLTLRLDRRLHGEDPAGYHATNVLAHALCCLLLSGLALRLRERSGEAPFPWFGVSLFACHPVLADSVAWISGRTSMVSACFGLLGAWLLCGARRPLAIAATCGLGVLGALFGKEDGVVFALLYLVLCRDRRERLSALVGLALAGALYATLRHAALGELLPSAPHAPLAHASLGERLVVGGAAIVEGLRLLALPFGYAPQYRVEDLAPDASGVRGGLVAGLAWIFWSACATAPLFAKRGRVAAWSCSLAALSVLPVLQLVPAGEVFAPRFLYPVLLFGSLFLDDALRRVVPPGRAADGLRLALLVACCALAWQRAHVYSSRAAYREAVLARHPDDSRSWNGLGHAYFEEGRVELAREAWRRAVRIEPRYSRPWTNLGISFYQEGELDDALACFQQARSVGPGNAIARVWCGRVELLRGEFDEALTNFEHATRLSPGLAPAWQGRAEAELGAGRPRAARASIERALELAPRSPGSRALERRIEEAIE